MTQSSRIIVLHLTKYGDSGLVVHTIDSEAGRCSYMLRGAGRSSISKGAGRSKHVTVGSFHNLAVLDIVSVANPHSSMALLKEYEPALHLDSLRSDVDKNAITLFISELLYRTIVEQNYDPHLFAWLCQAISLLDSTGRTDVTGHGPASEPEDQTAVQTDLSANSVANFHLWFLAGFCTVMGFGPSREGIFDGCDLLSPENLALLRLLTTSEYTEAMAIPLSGARRRDFCDQMVRYISYHLGINLHLRSLDVLHDLYS